jgi:hypothetical protein
VVVLLVAAIGAAAVSPIGLEATPQSQNARYEVALTFEKISGLISGPTTCPKAKRDGKDVISGIVEGSETFVDGAIMYSGDLARTTRLEYCDSWRPKGSEDEWCVPILTGKQARVATTITIYRPASNQDAEVKYTPKISKTDSVDVKGACTSEMELGIVQGYLEPEGFTIDTRNQPPLPRLIEKRSWQDVMPRPGTEQDGWTLSVIRKLQ